MTTFSGPNAPHPVTRGVPPSKSASVWSVAAAELTPDKSLARIQDHARWLVGSFGLVGSVMTGFGIAALSQLRPYLTFTLVGAALSVLGAALAGSALVIWPTRVAPGNLAEVSSWFTNRLKIRGLLVVSATVTFIMSLLVGIVPLVLVTTSSSGSISVSFRWQAQEPPQTPGSTVEINITASENRPGTSFNITVRSVRRSADCVGSFGHSTNSPICSGQLFDQQATIGTSGTLSVPVDIQDASTYSALQVRGRVGSKAFVRTFTVPSSV